MARFDIRIEGFEPGVDAVAGLVRVFEVDRAVAERIAASVPATVRRGVPSVTAEQYYHALRSIGARVRLVSDDAASHRPPSTSLGPPSAAVRPAVASAAPMAASSFAALEERVRFVCRSCGRSFAEAELAVVELRAGQRMRLCPDDRSPVDVDHQARRGAFFPALVGAFAYPIQKNAPVVFVGVALVAQLLSYLWIVGQLMSAGVVLGYLFTVIKSSANGKRDLPLGQDFIDLWDLLGPVVRYLLTIAIAFAPAVAVLVLVPMDNLALFVLAEAVACLLGLVYLPAGVIVAAQAPGCVSPFAGFAIIARIPGPYFLTTAFVAVTAAVDVVIWVVATLSDQVIPIPFVPGFVARMVAFYFPLVICRMLGLLIYHHEEQLGLD